MLRFTCRRFVWASILAVNSLSLYAVDGVVLIDQNRAMAGNITPGDGPGFPITISQPGSYRLAGNLTVPDAMTTGIEITASSVTLDLNGFGITGPNTCTPNPTTCIYSGGGVGVHAGSFSPGVVAPSNVKVMNGFVRGMGFHGVRLMGEGTVVELVNASGNGGPGIVVGNGSVFDSMATLNGGTTGIIALAVHRSTASSNRGVGMFIRNYGVASGNVSMGNGGDGINATKASLTGNTASFNKGFGMAVTCPGSVTGNTAVDNQGGAFNLTGACTLADNAQ
jgi:hypothetical protein